MNSKNGNGDNIRNFEWLAVMSSVTGRPRAVTPKRNDLVSCLSVRHLRPQLLAVQGYSPGGAITVMLRSIRCGVFVLRIGRACSPAQTQT